MDHLSNNLAEVTHDLLLEAYNIWNDDSLEHMGRVDLEHNVKSCVAACICDMRMNIKGFENDMGLLDGDDDG